MHTVYAGFRNLVTPLAGFEAILPEAVSKTRVLPDFGPFIAGHDPIPEVTLYGNSKANFVAPGGEGPPTAAAIYDRRTGQLRVATYEQAVKFLRLIRLGN